ncbi:hypothetical protein VTN00DRAFT_7209 [Thermoascus crustaceus]|uniref:uncharacterized protein n=1 Tax=Thermoascus crustaceus TaxID=5088 RepID=UPI00374201B3
MRILPELGLAAFLISMPRQSAVYGLEYQTSSTPKTPASWSGCPIEGSLLPRPTDLSKSQHIKAATDNLKQALDSAISGKIKAGWDVENTTFSIALVSPNSGISEGNTKSIIWEYHHLSEANVNGTKKLNGDSQYLIGSISKLISDLMLLESGLNLEDTITTYLPELKNERSLIRWENITLAALSDHLAGIPPNIPGSFELYSLRPLYEQLGFPHLEKDDFPDCGVDGLNGACTRAGKLCFKSNQAALFDDSNRDIEILENLLHMHPVAPPYSRPVYSQLSFTLFSMAMSAVTGKNYSQLLDEMIIQPLGLQNTGPSPVNAERAVIPPVEQETWRSDFGYAIPGGGLYSSTNDLSALMTRILDYSIIENPVKARKLLKPHSMTPSMKSLVGQPWEIQRTTNLTPEHPDTIDIYGKTGGVPDYISHFAAVDQYGVGFVILTAGPSGSDSIINDAVIGSIVPAVEEEAREQAQMYTGTYKSTNTTAASRNTSDAPVTMIITLETGKPGLKLNSLIRNNTTILSALKTLWSQMLGPMIGTLNDDFRLYPSGIKTPVPETPHLIRQDWRISFDIVPPDNAAKSDLPAQGALSPDYCASWNTADLLYYGGEPMDRVVFVVDTREKRVVGVEVPFLRTGVLGKEGV